MSLPVTKSANLLLKAEGAPLLFATGAVTLIQRFGSALNLNIHFHILFLDGVYIGGANERPMRERDTRNIYLAQETVDVSDEDPSNQLLGSSITYRIALGSQQGRKVFTLQTLPDCESDSQFVSMVGGCLNQGLT